MTFRWMLIASTLLPITCAAQDRDAICGELSDELVAQMASPPLNKDYRLYDVQTFYSDKLDACIHVEEKLIGAEVFVRDLARSVIKNDISVYPPVLLHCDVSGVDEVDIEAVRELRGSVRDVPYKEWMTNGQGGLPRALETPIEPLKRADCEIALDRWLQSWGP